METAAFSLHFIERSRENHTKDEVVSLLLHDIAHWCEEERLTKNRKKDVANQVFELDAVDGQVCLERVRIAKAHIQKVVDKID